MLSIQYNFVCELWYNISSLILQMQCRIKISREDLINTIYTAQNRGDRKTDQSRQQNYVYVKYRVMDIWHICIVDRLILHLQVVVRPCCWLWHRHLTENSPADDKNCQRDKTWSAAELCNPLDQGSHALLWNKTHPNCEVENLVEHRT